MCNPLTIIYITILLGSLDLATCYKIDLVDNGPIVRGGKITITATVYNDDNQRATNSFEFDWIDNAIPSHSRHAKSKAGSDKWIIEFDANLYPQGPYNVQVAVCRYILSVYCYPVGSNRITFFVTENLNGEIQLIQNNQTRKDVYISSTEVVNHTVAIKDTDMDFISKAPKIITHWFIDCTYHGFTDNFTFLYNYTKPDEEHSIEALVVADFTPLPPPTTTPIPTTTTKPTTTTTTKPTTTTTTKPTTTTTTKPTTTTTTKATTTRTTKPITTTSRTTTSVTTTKTTTGAPKTTTTEHVSHIKINSVEKSVSKRDIHNISLNQFSNYTNDFINIIENTTLVPYNQKIAYICNGTKIATALNNTYGYFLRKVKVKLPVSKINVTGNNWLQHGDLLTLNIKCQASRTIQYCVEYKRGLYNVTGNENCTIYHELEACEFTIQRYFMESMEYTIIIIIQNEVSKKVTPVTVTVYKVNKQAQLSVIVVPVAFSLVAVVLIVFGVAYYFQNRSRFIVEVADFNFGQNFSDMEYKTFKERLRDSILNAFFNKAPTPSSSEVPVWPPGRKYGSMTN